MADRPRRTHEQKGFSFRSMALASVAGVALFVLGIGIGNGTISFTESLPVNQTNNELPQDLDYSSVEDVYDSLKANFDGELTAEQLLTGLKDGLAEATGDPYTEFFDEEEATSFNEDLNGTFSGIGAELDKEGETVVIVAPLAGFPAEKAGLRTGDAIIAINGESAYGISVTDAVNTIRGPIGTEVTLSVLRDQSEELEFTIERAEIKIPSVEYEIKENNIGYLRVTRFGSDTASLAREAAEEFRNKNVSGIVLDLRSNPGGLLSASIELSDLWLNEGAVVLEEKRDGQVVKTYRAPNGSLLEGIPTIVLQNEGSASASEITAGALRDNGTATILGAQSFGKGSVQSLVKLGDGTVLKVTVARWFTPGGDNIDEEGIAPDTVIEFTDEDYEAERDPQLDAALEALAP